MRLGDGFLRPDAGPTSVPASDVTDCISVAIQAAAIAGGGSVIVVLKEYAKKQLAGK